MWKADIGAAYRHIYLVWSRAFWAEKPQNLILGAQLTLQRINALFPPSFSKKKRKEKLALTTAMT